MKKITTPITKAKISKLNAGDEILLTGTIYTGRDQAHKRMTSMIKQGKNLPIDLKGQIIYYCGPTAAPRGKVIGSCGPTTSSRMDNLTEPLFKKGLLGMIGKGRRSVEVRNLIKKYKGIYFVAPSGCGALLAKKVIANDVVCFRELGPESICELHVENFPLIVGIDSKGNSIYKNLCQF